jgi:hypothetical protein
MRSGNTGFIPGIDTRTGCIWFTPALGARRSTAKSMFWSV